MRRRLTFACLLLACVAMAQERPPAPVRVPITATDKHHKPLPALTSENLIVLDNGTRAATVSVEKLHDAPMHYCLLFDSSNSGRQQFEVQQRTALEFLSRVPRPGVDVGIYVSFDKIVRVDGKANNTSDPETLARAVAAELPGGATAILDAVDTCAHHLGAPANGINAMFIFSDGGDNYSRLTLSEARDSALRIHARIYGFNSSPAPQYDERKVLWKLATASGGAVYDRVSYRSLRDQLQELEAHLRNQYAITFASNIRDGRMHKLEIRGPKNVRISAPNAYFSELPPAVK